MGIKQKAEEEGAGDWMKPARERERGLWNRVKAHLRRGLNIYGHRPVSSFSFACVCMRTRLAAVLSSLSAHCCVVPGLMLSGWTLSWIVRHCFDEIKKGAAAQRGRRRGEWRVDKKEEREEHLRFLSRARLLFPDSINTAKFLRLSWDCRLQTCVQQYHAVMILRKQESTEAKEYLIFLIFLTKQDYIHYTPSLLCNFFNDFCRRI